MDEDVKTEKIEDKEAKRFSDVYPQGTVFSADRVEMETVIDKEIVVKDISELQGPYGNFIAILAKIEDKEVQFGTGSLPVVQKLMKAKSENTLPLIIKIVKKKGKESGREYFDIE